MTTTTTVEAVGFKSFGAKTWLAVPAVLVGTYDDAGKANLTTAAWVGTVSSDPACVSVSLRPPRAAFAAVQARRAFTVCVVPASRVAALDFCGIVSGGAVDKVAELGWRTVRGAKVDAPVPLEATQVFECVLREAHDLGAHVQFVGEVADVRVRSDCLDERGLPDVARVAPVFYDPASSRYFGVGPFLGQAFAVGRTVQDAKK